MMLKKIIHFLTTDIWRLRLRTYSRLKAWPVKNLRVLILALRGYHEDKCQFRASALTFYTLLSIVPVLAMVFGIAKGFGYDEKLQDFLMEEVRSYSQPAETTQLQDSPTENITNAKQPDQEAQGLEQVAEKVITFSNQMLEKTKGGPVAGIGVAILFMTVIRVLGNIESSFNYIWGVKRARSLGRKFSDYLSIILICPILVILSISCTVYISSQITNIAENFQFFSVFQKLLLYSLKFLPYISLWVVFSFIFIFMPNTKVKVSSGVLAGIITGTIFQIVQILYIKTQFGVAKSNAIYGSFAALPLFLVWLQLSWFIVLFGAEFSFAHQNVETYELEPDCLGVSYETKKKLALYITSILAKNFCTNKKSLTSEEISRDNDIPIRLVRDIMYELTAANITSQVNINDGRDFAYQPARDIEQLTIKNVTQALEQSGKSDLPVKRAEALEKLENSMSKMWEKLENCPENILLKNI